MEIVRPAGSAPANVSITETAITGLTFPNKWVVSWQPTTNTDALVAGGYDELNYDSAAYDVVSGGHGIGRLGVFRHRTPRDVILGIGIEGVVEITGGGYMAAGFTDIVEVGGGGVFDAYAGLLLRDQSAVLPGVPLYGALQLGSTAWNLFRGRIWGAQQSALGGVPKLPEIAPAVSPGIASGRYYTTPHGSSITTLAFAGANILYCCPFFVPERTTWTEIGVEVTTAAAAGKKIRVGLYRAYAGRPQELILDGGENVADSTGLKTSAVSQILEAGWYFLAAFSDGTPTVRAIVDTATTLHGLTNTTATDTLIGASATYGAMPNPFPATLIYANGGTVVPLLWMRK